MNLGFRKLIKLKVTVKGNNNNYCRFEALFIMMLFDLVGQCGTFQATRYYCTNDIISFGSTN